ncbi:hypothetical protein C8R45DRAFT_1108008 [Mycena sanguinolenta]|nr:hypothetical protein C8R45DRAFT_1108008 [Mycena sanguinolenta]
MSDGWTRFQSGDVFNNTSFISLSACCDTWSAWLSQANYILRRLRIRSNFEDYGFLYLIHFKLDISETTRDPPAGFLFLCPGEHFRIGPSSFCWPACPAYWSLDPSGIDCLSPEDATRLGFPLLEFITTAEVWYWDSSVYEGLRQFHQAKGFDPYSQDVARHLGHPLWQLSSQRDASNGEDFDADIASDDYESKHPPTSACDDSDLELDAESSHIEENVHDAADKTDGSEHREESNCANDDVESIEFAPSRSWNLLMTIQIGSILFLGLSWVYDHVAVSFV